MPPDKACIATLLFPGDCVLFSIVKMTSPAFCTTPEPKNLPTVRLFVILVVGIEPRKGVVGPAQARGDQPPNDQSCPNHVTQYG